MLRLSQCAHTFVGVQALFRSSAECMELGLRVAAGASPPHLPPPTSSDCMTSCEHNSFRITCGSIHWFWSIFTPLRGCSAGQAPKAALTTRVQGGGGRSGRRSPKHAPESEWPRGEEHRVSSPRSAVILLCGTALLCPRNTPLHPHA